MPNCSLHVHRLEAISRSKTLLRIAQMPSRLNCCFTEKRRKEKKKSNDSHNFKSRLSPKKKRFIHLVQSTESFWKGEIEMFYWYFSLDNIPISVSIIATVVVVGAKHGSIIRNGYRTGNMTAHRFFPVATQGTAAKKSHAPKKHFSH